MGLSSARGFSGDVGEAAPWPASAINGSHSRLGVLFLTWAENM